MDKEKIEFIKQQLNYYSISQICKFPEIDCCKTTAYKFAKDPSSVRIGLFNAFYDFLKKREIQFHKN